MDNAKLHGLVDCPKAASTKVNLEQLKKHFAIGKLQTRTQSNKGGITTTATRAVRFTHLQSVRTAFPWQPACL